MFCSASTSRRFSAWDTRRTIASASGEVTRRPSTVCFSMPAAASSASSCGPAPWITIGVRPTCCRNASDETRLSRSSRSTAPPTLTTAKRAASSCEKRLRYCWISFALPMFDSRRTMVERSCLCASMAIRVDDPDVAFGNLLQLGQVRPIRRRCAPGRCRRDHRRTRCSRPPRTARLRSRNRPRCRSASRIRRRGRARPGVAPRPVRYRRPAATGRGRSRRIRPAPDRRRRGTLASNVIGIHRRQRPETEAHLRRRRDHVGLDAAFDPADVEAQSGQATETLVRLAFDEIQRARSPAHRLMHRAVADARCRRRMSGATGKTHPHRTDAAMREHGFAARRLGDDDGVERHASAPETPTMQRASLASSSLREQQRHVARVRAAAVEQRRRRTLDVAGAEADRALIGHAQLERIARPVRRGRHRIQMHVEQNARLAAHGKKAHRAGAMIGHRAIETRAAAHAHSRKCRPCRSRAADSACRRRRARAGGRGSHRAAQSNSDRRSLAIHLRPQRRTHAVQADESFGLGDAPVGRLRIGRALGRRADAAT